MEPGRVVVVEFVFQGKGSSSTAMFFDVCNAVDERECGTVDE